MKKLVVFIGIEYRSGLL